VFYDVSEVIAKLVVKGGLAIGQSSLRRARDLRLTTSVEQTQHGKDSLDKESDQDIQTRSRDEMRLRQQVFSSQSVSFDC
jgi:hypothetical protein